MSNSYLMSTVFGSRSGGNSVGEFIGSLTGNLLGGFIGGGASGEEPWYTLGKADDTDPSFWADFANNRYAVNGSEEAFSDIFTFTRSTAGTYFDSNGVMQTAAINAPRFDHDPSTGEKLGLLIEEQRTNLLTQTMSFSSGWAIYRSTASTDGTVAAPTGDLGVLKIIPQEQLSNVNQSISVTNGVTYTVSFYAKSVSGTKNVRAGIYNGSSAIAGSDFEINDSTWTRVYYTFTATSTISYQIQLRNGSAGDVGGFYVWGAQCEQGSFPTSYIPTPSSAVTRSADYVENTGSNTVPFSSWFTAGIGTLLGIGKTGGETNNSMVLESFASLLSSSNTFITGYFREPYSSGRAKTLIRLGSATQADMTNASAVSTNSPTKVAIGFNANDFAISANGVTPTLDVSGSVPTVDTLYIGRSSSSIARQMTIGEVRYYPIRVSNSEMQRITT